LYGKVPLIKKHTQKHQKFHWQTSLNSQTQSQSN